MRLEKPINENYCGTVIEIKTILPLVGCDNVVAVPIFGYQGIVSKDVKVGDRYIVFTPETRLSHEFISKNNLYRHSELNEDKTQKGYLEDNGRVRAVRFRGHTSNCLLMPMDSLLDFTDKVDELDVGDTFDYIGGVKICEKYLVPVKERTQREQTPKKSRVEQKHMPEHMSTSNFFKFFEHINDGDTVYITQKLHGTSIRIGNTYVKRKLSTLEKIASFFGVRVQEYEHDYIYGSRKVIKDVNNNEQQHFYDTDVWTEEGQKLVGLLPKNYIVYGELVGWTGTKELQKNYSYMIPVGHAELYVYRVAIVNEDGQITDLSWKQVKEFCRNTGLKYVPELFKVSYNKTTETLIHTLMNKRYADEIYGQEALPLKDGLVDEGVCIRVDGIVPTIYKAKAPKFLEHETQLLDSGEEDIESSQSDNV